jgi:tellurite resistance protein TerC
MFFLLQGMMDRFHYLPVGLGLVLAFVGVKMLAQDFYPLSIGLSLGIVALFLAGAVIASLLYHPPKRRSK